MAKFKCPHCGHLQNRDGVCEGCDISKVLPINNKPNFIKGVRYKCNSCNRRFRVYYDVCPNCGSGKLMPQYKNHKQLKKTSRFLRIVFIVLLIAAIFFGSSFILHNYYPEMENRLFSTISIKAAELKSAFSSYISNFAQQGNRIPVSNGGNPNNHQNTPQSVLPRTLSIGDTATIGGLEFTIKRIVFSDYAGDMEGYASRDSDYKYCVVYLDAYNPTNETIVIREDIINHSAVCYYEATLLFDGEVNYNHSFGNYTEFFFGNADVLPRATLTDKVISFKVPVSISTSDAPLVLSVRERGNDKSSWKLR